MKLNFEKYDLAKTNHSYNLIEDHLSILKENNEDFVLTEDIYNSFSEIALLSSNKSQSSIYKSLIHRLIDKVSPYKNKNISEINNLLNQ